MEKGLVIKNLILIAGLLIATLGTKIIYAQDESAPPTNAPPQNDASQFQTWVKNNGENQPPVGAPPSISTTPSPGLPPNPGQPSLVVVSPEGDKGNNTSLTEQPLTYRQSQLVMLNSVPPSIGNRPESADEADAFSSMAQQNMPMTPKQVVRLRQLIDGSQRAASVPANIPPKPVSSTLMINLAPGATPPAIRLAQGYVSSLVFVDSTGAPWPIASYDIGDPKSVNLQWDNKSNILLIQAISPYGDSNLVVRLVGLPTPVTLELVAGQRVVDYRADIHVSGIGPNSKDLPIGTQLPESASQLLLNVLDGIGPPGSKQLVIKGRGECQAWLLGEKMYLRTRFTVLSPGWVGRMVSPDGMNAYEIQRTSSVLVSQYGEPVSLKVEGF